MDKNSKAFTPEEVKKGLLNDLINYLLDYNKKSDDSYYDIHITTDGYCQIVEWIDVSYEYKEDYGKFEFVEPDQYIFREYIFPDNHSEYFETEDEYNEVLSRWLKKHKKERWVKNDFGRWVSLAEEEANRKYFEENLKSKEDHTEEKQ